MRVQRDATLKRVRQIMTREGFLEEEVTMSASLRNDLGMDSLDIVQLVMDLEEEFGLDPVDDAIAGRWQKVGDAVEHICSQLPVLKAKECAKTRRGS